MGRRSEWQVGNVCRGLFVFNLPWKFPEFCFSCLHRSREQSDSGVELTERRTDFQTVSKWSQCATSFFLAGSSMRLRARLRVL